MPTGLRARRRPSQVKKKFLLFPPTLNGSGQHHTPEFFVRQNYLDFLGREPDQGGLDYWSHEIRGCNGDADCLNTRRIGFVLMEYFGYLRRDPDAEGYDFWLDTLNNRARDNYRSMVCAFITSKEYQQRRVPTATAAGSSYCVSLR